jgi:inner membrane protein
MILMATTGSVLASTLAALGSTFPDTVERFFGFVGSFFGGKGRNRHHRRTSHWFVLYGAAFGLCFFVWGEAILPRLRGFPRTFAERPWAVVFSCAAFWFLGGLLHVLCDACCGKVPLLIPWRRTFGWKFFRMSGARGEMSRGEAIFTGFIALSCLCAWILRYAQDKI